MEPELRILHIEDQPADSRIVQEQLRRDGLEADIHRVETFDEFAQALQQGACSLVLSDYSLPAIDPLEALRFARQHHPELPFIFLSGTLGEEQAIECLKLGATDYVLKQRLSRLVPAIRRALQEAEEHARRKQAEAELRQANEAQARLAAIVESSQDPILSTTLEGIVTTWNPAAERLFGYAAAEVIGKPNPIVPPDRQQDEGLFNQRVRAGALVRQFETARLTKDGRRLEVQITLSPLRDPSGQVVGSSRIIHDITHRRRAEAAIREHQERLTLTTLAAQLGTWDWNILSDDLVWSPRCLELFALPAGTRMTYRRFLEAVHPEDRQRIDQVVRAALERHEPYDIEIRVPWPDGSIHWVASRGRAYYDPAGQPTRMSGIALDITDRKRAELAAAELQRKLDTGLLAGEVAIFEWDHLRQRFWGNTHFARFFGVTPDQLSTFSFSDLLAAIHPDDRPIVSERIQRTIETGAPYEAEYRILARGQTRWVIARASRQCDEAGRPTRFPGILVDITEQKRAQEALRHSEDRYRGLFNSIDEAFCIVEMLFDQHQKPIDYRFLTTNPAFAKQLQLTGAEGKTARELTPDIEPYWFDLFAKVALTGQPTRYQHQVASWNRWFEGYAFRVGPPERRHVGILFNDITDRKQAEDQLKRQTLHLQLLHQASARLLVGQQPVDLLRQLHPQIAQAFGADAFMLYQAEPSNTHATDHLRLLACAGISEEQRQKLETLRYGRAVGARPTEALQPIIATQIQTKEAPNRHFLRKLGFRSYLYYPLILNHHIHGTVAFASHTRDDYDQMDLDFFHTIASTLAEALERERLENELQRHAAGLEKTVQERTARLQETIAELEQMSYSMIHDLRAPLRAIQSFGGIVAEDPENRLTDESRELLRQMRTASHRMDHLVCDVLNYGQVVREELPLAPVDVGALARGIVETYPELRSSGAQVEIAPNLPLVQANSAALTQCLSQLFGNAIKFVKPGVMPQIRLWAEQKRIDGLMDKWMGGSRGTANREEHSSNHPAIQPSTECVRLWVQDNGVGIPPELQAKVFGMFQQLRKTGEGTGMGLAIVKKAVERMGGRVGVESEPGQGSRFWIELKAAAQPASEPAQSLTE